MPNNTLVRAIRRVHLIAAAWMTCMSPTWADVIYNYDGGWLFDSATGLYWQIAQVPSSTLIPSAGIIPEFGLVTQLASDAGIPLLINGGVNPSAAYSPTLANFLSFFASDSAAVPGATIEFSALYQYPVDRPQGGYQYLVFNYSPDPNSANWLYYSVSTVGTYGPGHPCESAVCPPTEPAFVYSTVQPTPLPATTWLLLSGLALLGIGTIRAGLADTADPASSLAA